MTELPGEHDTEAVVAQLGDRLDRARDSQERKEALLAIAREIASRLSPETRMMDVDEYLYDEHGLPK